MRGPLHADVRPQYLVPLVTRIRPRIGDVVEIPTPKGLAYAQYTHKHDEPPRYGALIRVLPGIFNERLTEFAMLVAQKPLFMTFFPLGAACNRRIVQIVAAEPVPPHSREWPIFRNAPRAAPGPATSGPLFLFDGARNWRVDSLTDAQRREYPPLRIWNDTLLIDRIICGWRHEDD